MSDTNQCECEHDPNPIDSDPVAGRSGWFEALCEELDYAIYGFSGSVDGNDYTTINAELARDLMRPIGGETQGSSSSEECDA